MARKTIEGVCAKLDAMHEDILEMKPDVKKNTAFRNQAKGMWTAFILVGTALGTVAGWIISRFGGK